MLRPLFLSLPLLFLINCVPSGPQAHQSAESATCPLPPGKYEIQSVTHQAGSYQMMVLKAPSCFQQPLTLTNLQLARLENSEPTAARVEFFSEENATLFMKETFQIQLVQAPAEGASGESTSSMWSPFLAGAAGAMAGAAVGAMVANKFKKPQYYVPPTPKPGQKSVQGFGGRGSSMSAALDQYEKNNGKRPSNVVPMKRSSSSQVTKPTPTRKKVVRRKTFRRRR